MDSYVERQMIKGFGQLINDEFYKGKEKLFPFNRFYGYHAGVDLEAFPDEQGKKVPVYAIYSGRISYIGSLSGYGGVILQKLDGGNATALYGHVKIKNLSFKVGDLITFDNKPTMLTFLGDEFSEETSRERKHLHFGIYKGAGLYFRGHENSFSQLAAKWHDPLIFLKEKNAKNPAIVSSPKTIINKNDKTVEKNSNFLYTLLNLFKTLLIRE